MSISQNDINIKMFGYQAIPLIGPLVVSPLVAVVSTVQIVAGGIFAFCFGLFGTDSRIFKDAMWHVKDGAIDLAYSILNISTLGASGLVCYFGTPLLNMG